MGSPWWMYIVLAALSVTVLILSYSQNPSLLRTSWCAFAIWPLLITTSRYCIVFWQAHFWHLNSPIRKRWYELPFWYIEKTNFWIFISSFCLFFIYVYQWPEDLVEFDFEFGLWLAMGLGFVIALADLVSEFDESEVNECLKDSQSIGAFWAHGAFKAYYEVILDDIVKRMKTFEKDHKIQFCTKKLIIVFPLSCNVTKMLDRGSEDSIEVFGELENLDHDQGANLNRKYKNTVYKITEDFEEFYIVAEYPSSLNTLWLFQDTIDEDDDRKPQIGKMSRVVWNYHRDCFAKYLEHLVKDYPCIVLKYDDQKEQSLSIFLKSELQKRGYLEKKSEKILC